MGEDAVPELAAPKLRFPLKLCPPWNRIREPAAKPVPLAIAFTGPTVHQGCPGEVPGPESLHPERLSM